MNQYEAPLIHCQGCSMYSKKSSWDFVSCYGGGQKCLRGYLKGYVKQEKNETEEESLEIVLGVIESYCESVYTKELQRQKEIKPYGFDKLRYFLSKLHSQGKITWEKRHGIVGFVESS